MNNLAKIIISAAATAAVNYLFNRTRDGLTNQINNVINKEEDNDLTFDDDCNFILNDSDDE